MLAMASHIHKVVLYGKNKVRGRLSNYVIALSGGRMKKLQTSVNLRAFY